MGFLGHLQIVVDQLLDQLDEQLLLGLDLLSNSQIVLGDFGHRFDAPATVEVLVFEKQLEEIKNGQDLWLARLLGTDVGLDVLQKSGVLELQIGKADVFLRLEMIVQGGLGNARFGNDLIDARRIVAVLVEQLRGSLNDSIFDF